MAQKLQCGWGTWNKYVIFLAILGVRPDQYSFSTPPPLPPLIFNSITNTTNNCLTCGQLGNIISNIHLNHSNKTLSFTYFFPSNKDITSSSSSTLGKVGLNDFILAYFSHICIYIIILALSQSGTNQVKRWKQTEQNPGLKLCPTK